ncbi:unnamed protein product [Closterium sp. Naga37s-1]|nr:unnamed protein product [Closterium sp. Naga37s-1]
MQGHLVNFSRPVGGVESIAAHLLLQTPFFLLTSFPPSTAPFPPSSSTTSTDDLKLICWNDLDLMLVTNVPRHSLSPLSASGFPLTADLELICWNDLDLTLVTNVAHHPELSQLKSTAVIEGQEVEGFFAFNFTFEQIQILRVEQRYQWRDKTLHGRLSIPTLSAVLALVLSSNQNSELLAARGNRPVGLMLEPRYPEFHKSIGCPLLESLLTLLSMNNLQPPPRPSNPFNTLTSSSSPTASLSDRLASISTTTISTDHAATTGAAAPGAAKARGRIVLDPAVHPVVIEARSGSALVYCSQRTSIPLVQILEAGWDEPSDTNPILQAPPPSCPPTTPLRACILDAISLYAVAVAPEKHLVLPVESWHKKLLNQTDLVSLAHHPARQLAVLPWPFSNDWIFLSLSYELDPLNDHAMFVEAVRLDGHLYTPYIRHPSSLYTPYIRHPSSLYTPYIRHPSSLYTPYIRHPSSLYTPYIRHPSSLHPSTDPISLFHPYSQDPLNEYAMFVEAVGVDGLSHSSLQPTSPPHVIPSLLSSPLLSPQDPLNEYAMFVEAVGVDGLFSDFPATALKYIRNNTLTPTTFEAPQNSFICGRPPSCVNRPRRITLPSYSCQPHPFSLQQDTHSHSPVSRPVFAFATLPTASLTHTITPFPAHPGSRDCLAAEQHQECWVGSRDCLAAASGVLGALVAAPRKRGLADLLILAVIITIAVLPMAVWTLYAMHKWRQTEQHLHWQEFATIHSHGPTTASERQPLTALAADSDLSPSSAAAAVAAVAAGGGGGAAFVAGGGADDLSPSGLFSPRIGALQHHRPSSPPPLPPGLGGVEDGSALSSAMAGGGRSRGGRRIRAMDFGEEDW